MKPGDSFIIQLYQDLISLRSGCLNHNAMTLSE